MSVFKNFIGGRATSAMIDEVLIPLSEVKNEDFVIAVMDRGWVFVGFITLLENKRIRLDCCHNIHQWGTSKGLGELAVEGPKQETILYEAGTVFGEPVFVMSADLSKW